MTRIDKLMSENGIKFKVLSSDENKMDGDKSGITFRIFDCRLSRGRKSFTFKIGVPLSETECPPVGVVLDSMTKYGCGSFRDFCKATGSDAKDVELKNSYNAIKDEYEGIEKIFGEQLNELQEMYEDGSWKKEC